MTVQSENERNKAVVDEYFKAGVQGHLTSFVAYLHPDFTVTAPNYLPWSGRHVGAAFFRDISATEIVALDKRVYASAGSEQERKCLVWMAPALQGVMSGFGVSVGCSLVFGLFARSWTAGPDGFRGRSPILLTGL